MKRFLSLLLAATIASAVFVTSVQLQTATAAEAPTSAVVQVESAQPASDAAAEVPAMEGRAFPVLIVLAVLARLGIQAVLKQYGKTQLKKAAKSFLLNSIDANKWSHIRQAKHKWPTVGGKSKESIAEIMSNAMANGKHARQGTSTTSMQATWSYKGKTIVVTYSKATGKIGNGYVK